MGSRDVAQEVRDVVKTSTEVAMEVATVVDRMHLMDPLRHESVGIGHHVGLDGIFDCVEHRSGLSVGQRHDDVGVGLE